MDADKIAVALYLVTRRKDENGTFWYTPFPTLAHIKHEVFCFADLHNFLDIYNYEAGDFMPQSKDVDKGIEENFNYNPVFDCYELKDVKIGEEFNKWIEKNTDHKKELLGIRDKCETYTAQELYLVLYETEEQYIKNFKKMHWSYEELSHKTWSILTKCKYDSMFRPIPITEEKYDRLVDKFDKLIFSKTVKPSLN